jgi:hypothetical protein
MMHDTYNTKILSLFDALTNSCLKRCHVQYYEPLYSVYGTLCHMFTLQTKTSSTVLGVWSLAGF